MNIGVHWRNIVGGEGNTVIMCGVDVVENVMHGFHVAGHWLICVG